jgi:hypothetical protein
MTQKSAVVEFKQILGLNQSAIQEEPGSTNLQFKTYRVQPVCNSRRTGLNQSAIQEEHGSTSLQFKKNRAQPICNSRRTGVNQSEVHEEPGRGYLGLRV